MKKLLKSEICGSVNIAHHALFTEKVKYFGSKKKKKQKKRKTFVWEARFAPVVLRVLALFLWH